MSEYEERIARLAAQEPGDIVWSSTVHSSIAERITSKHIQAELKSVRCGLSLCVASFTHEGRNTHTVLFRDLLELGQIAPGFGGPALLRRHETSSGSYETTIYMARVGGSLPPRPDAPTIDLETREE
ncbi:MAG: hypothetical protein R3B13_37415 [Polyangiaceae bacterium]